MTESRLIAWASVLVGVVCAYPTARELWQEWRVRQASLAEQAAQEWSIPEQRLPAEAMRDIYDSTRGSS